MGKAVWKHRRAIFKELLARMVLGVLGCGIQAVHRLDGDAQKELAGFPEGTTIVIRPSPWAKAMVIQKRNGVFRYLGSRMKGGQDYLITFKSLNLAIKVLLGLQSIEQAYWEHRFTLEGDVHTALPLIRALNRVEAYLFPLFWIKRIQQYRPGLKRSKAVIYLYTLWLALGRRKF